VRITILGSGSSGGIPVPGYGWGKCDPDNPKNYRLRPSILVQQGKTQVLIDTSPDLREQLLTADVKYLDGVIYTHTHADHLHGIDDIRGLNRAMNGPIEAYGMAESLKDIETRFGYVLQPLPETARKYFKPTLNGNCVRLGDDILIGNLTFQTFDQDHGFSRTMGLRVGEIAYSTDVVNMPEESFKVIEGVDTWIIGVFTDSEHTTHVHVEKALGWIERIKPRRAILTHLGPSLDYQQLSNQLPDHVEAAYDGLVIEMEEG